MPDNLQSDPLPLSPASVPAGISATTTTSAKSTGTRPTATRKRTHPIEQAAHPAAEPRKEVKGEYTRLLSCRVAITNTSSSPHTSQWADGIHPSCCTVSPLGGSPVQHERTVSACD